MKLSLAAVVLALVIAPGAAQAGPPRWQTLPLPPAMPAPDSEGTADSAGAKIYYGVWGQGAPVVLLHGGLGNTSHFAFQLPALVDKFQVIAIDSRGQGRSSRGSGPLSYDQMARDVVAVLDKLGIQRAAFVGWSDGGEVALKLGIAAPERVDRLFVFGANYDAAGSRPRRQPSATWASYAARCRSDYERLARAGQSHSRSYREMVESLLPLWRAPIGITRDQLRRIAAPTVIADGEHDEIIVLAQLEEMAQLIPHARLKVFANASHFALWQDPASFNAALLEFLTEPASRQTVPSRTVAEPAFPRDGKR